MCFCGCVQQRYYASPFNGNQGTYHPVPLESDSVKSRYYATAAIVVGGANDEVVDDVIAFHGSVSGGHRLGPVQAFYSLNYAVGRYTVDSAQDVPNPGGKSFSGTGFEGGVNVVVPIKGGEWRLVGLELASWNEGGGYLQFRKALPQDAVDLVVKSKRLVTLGGYTEVITIVGKVDLGFRLGFGRVLGHSHYIFDPYEGAGRLYRYKYGYFTTHLTRMRYTGFLRLNFATKADNAMLGLNYRLF